MHAWSLNDILNITCVRACITIRSLDYIIPAFDLDIRHNDMSITEHALHATCAWSGSLVPSQCRLLIYLKSSSEEVPVNLILRAVRFSVLWRAVFPTILLSKSGEVVTSSIPVVINDNGKESSIIYHAICDSIVEAAARLVYDCCWSISVRVLTAISSEYKDNLHQSQWDWFILPGLKFVYAKSGRTVLHRHDCHLLLFTCDHDAYVTTQISDISRSAGDEAEEAPFRSKIPTLLLSESRSLSLSDRVVQLYIDVDATDDSTAPSVANFMRRFQMASTGNKLIALPCT
jgi:hypothetical protein